MTQKAKPRKPGNIAALTFRIGSAAGKDVQLLPAGEFKATDGRAMPWGTWKLTEANAPAVVALANSRANEFVIDYEHQTQLADMNGQPAPAAGWFKTVEFCPGKGLFATDARWTARATSYIDADEYKYISAVFAYDLVTGEVQRLVCAALTNNPGLDGMDAVQLAALTARFSTADIDPAHSSVDNPSEKSMNPVLAALLAALGLPATDATTQEQALSAVATLKAATADLRKAAGVEASVITSDAVAAVATLKANADKLPGLTTEIATLKAGSKTGEGEPDPSKWVSMDSFNKLHGEVALLKTTDVSRQVEELLAGARAEGKCSAVVEGVWRNLGMKDYAQLKELVDKTPGNPVLAGQSQTAGKKDVIDPKAPGTADELAMCKNLGLTLEQFRSGAVAA